MGEAKRRKEFDPSYGKVRKNLRELMPDIPEEEIGKALLRGEHAEALGGHISFGADGKLEDNDASLKALTEAAEQGALIVSAALEDATITGAIPRAEIDASLEEVERVLRERSDNPREHARQYVIQALNRNAQCDFKEGSGLLATLLWLAMTSEAGPVLKVNPPARFHYEITQLGPTKYNFRLIAGGVP
jgi:hypothetical protein